MHLILPLSVLTVICLAALPLLVQAWRGERELPLFGFGLLALISRRDARRRAGPAVFVSADLLCLAGWGFVVSKAVGAALGVVWLASAVAVFTVASSGRPAFLVPPHLR